MDEILITQALRQNTKAETTLPLHTLEWTRLILQLEVPVRHFWQGGVGAQLAQREWQDTHEAARELPKQASQPQGSHCL